MRNTEVLQYIIKEIESSDIAGTYKYDKGLFELICHPIPYGNDEKSAKETIQKKILEQVLEKKCNKDEKKEISMLINDIYNLDEDVKTKNKRRTKLALLVKELISNKKIDTSIDIVDLTFDIPFKSQLTNYSTSFSNWKNKKDGKQDDIEDPYVKEIIQKNFEFEKKLWTGYGDDETKEMLKKHVEEFVKKQLDQNNSSYLLDELKLKFYPNKDLTNEENEDLSKIRDMNKTAFQNYNNDKKEPFTQIFLLELIPILYSKGFNNLLIEDVYAYLEPELKNNYKIRKFYTNALGSSEVKKYREAFEEILLLQKEKPDDKDLVDMQTAAISNLRREQLREAKDLSDVKKTVQIILPYYQKLFENKNNLYHYYPAVNLAYMTKIVSIMFDGEIQLTYTVEEISYKSQQSINDEISAAQTPVSNYYATMTRHELYILCNKNSMINSYLEEIQQEDNEELLTELERTYRQMKSFRELICKFDGEYSYKNSDLKMFKNLDDILKSFETVLGINNN